MYLYTVVASDADGVYAVVRCEKEVAKTQKSIAGQDPAWNSSVILYRKQPNKTHITVEVGYIRSSQ